MAADRYAIKPAAQAWRWALPAFVRDRIRGVVSNLTEPLVLANDILQLRVRAAGITLGRLLLNSTYVLAGMFDIAASGGMARQSGDFGQTLYAWGLDSGPYLVIPLLGPSNLRDAFGQGIDIWANPIGRATDIPHWGWINFGSGALRGIDLREQNIETLDALQSTSLDFYATLRSVSQQRRRAELQEVRPLPAAPGEELEDPGPTVPEGGPAQPGGVAAAPGNPPPAGADAPSGSPALPEGGAAAPPGDGQAPRGPSPP